MPKYLVTTVRDMIRYTSYIVEADSQEEAKENYDERELSDEWYEPSGDTYIEELEEITD